jgi:hypothetical protein
MLDYVNIQGINKRSLTVSIQFRLKAKLKSALDFNGILKSRRENQSWQNTMCSSWAQESSAWQQLTT